MAALDFASKNASYIAGAHGSAHGFMQFVAMIESYLNGPAPKLSAVPETYNFKIGE